MGGFTPWPSLHLAVDPKDIHVKPRRFLVIPAQAGIQSRCPQPLPLDAWISAFAGMTVFHVV
jgi:hypothetical protein